LPSFNDCERKASDLELVVCVRTRTSLPSLIAPVYVRKAKRTTLQNSLQQEQIIEFEKILYFIFSSKLAWNRTKS